MHRLIIMTVGKTHSGKTTFAKQLESLLPQSVVIDQDNHAEFVNNHYSKLRPKAGPNTLKFTVTNAIVEYAVQQSDFHIIMSNSNLNKSARADVLRYFHEKGFKSVIVYFDLPSEMLKERVERTQRSKAIFRSASSFLEVLERQEMSQHEQPASNEANHLFIINTPDDSVQVIEQIIRLGM